MKIAKNSVVKMHYTLKNDNGETLDSSAGGNPLEYIQGLGQLIPGLESQLDGLEAGAKLQATVEPKDAYGERIDEMVNAMPKSEFPDADSVTPGMQFQVETDGGAIIVTVVEVKDDEIVLDGNHPLAGERLHFDVEVIEVREATEDELAHGHVHGEGCNH